MKETEKKKGDEDVNRRYPYYMTMEILSRLPIKSLLRFKTVCRHWCSLIRSPTFINMHFDRSNTDQPCLFVREVESNCLHIYSFNGEGEVEDDLNTFLEQRGTSCVASCNGLLCYYTLYGRPKDMWVCNLSTKQQIKLPPLPCPDNCLCFGFGFNPSTNEYTLVLDSYLSGCHLFTLGTTCWRKISSRPLEECKGYYVGDICINGVIHRNSTSDSLIILFDLKTEEFGTLSHPNNLNRYARISEFQGTLCLFNTVYGYFDGDDNDYFNLWLLKDYNTHSWDYHRFILPHPLTFSTINAVIFRNWEIMAVSHYNKSDGLRHPFYLHSYDLRTCLSKKIELSWLPTTGIRVTIGDYKENIIELTTG